MESSSSAQQQLIEYRMKKQREATSVTPQSSPTPTASPDPSSVAEEAKSVIPAVSSPSKEDESVWEAKQEEYKKGLLKGNIKPTKYKVYDFTKGSENEKRLQSQNYEFVSNGQTADPEYKKDDLKALHAAITEKHETRPVARGNVASNNNANAVRASPRNNPQPENRAYAEERNAEQPREDGNANDVQIPLLRSFGDDEPPMTRNFLCFRNVNRDILGLFAIAVLLGCVIGFLFLISK